MIKQPTPQEQFRELANNLTHFSSSADTLQVKEALKEAAALIDFREGELTELYVKHIEILSEKDWYKVCLENIAQNPFDIHPAVILAKQALESVRRAQEAKKENK